MIDLTSEEERFIRHAVKDALDHLHSLRRQCNSAGLLTGLMKVESDIQVAEAAWEKVKGGI